VLAGFSLIPGAWAMNNQALVVFAIVMALFLLFTHRENMRKLRNGTENRFERIRIFSRRRQAGPGT
jgi:glycerol-3-phosphate acyltransferase PlsY